MVCQPGCVEHVLFELDYSLEAELAERIKRCRSLRELFSALAGGLLEARRSRPDTSGLTAGSPDYATSLSTATMQWRRSLEPGSRQTDEPQPNITKVAVPGSGTSVVR